MRSALIIAVLLFSAIELHAQADSTSYDSSAVGGVTVTPGSISIGAQLSTDFDHPSVTLAFGSAAMSTSDLQHAVQRMGAIEVAFGSLEGKKLKSNPRVERASNDRVYLQLYSPRYLGVVDTTLNRMEGGRIGLHLTSGYSFMRDSAQPAFTLLHSGGPVWSFNHFDAARGNTGLVDTNDSRTLDGLHSSHFGTHTGFALRYEMSTTFAFQADFERTMMFQNSSFFGWFGSVFLEGITQATLSAAIIRKIEIKSPKSVPYAALILRSALSFGWYELRRSTQHFPFGGNRPMVSDAARFSLIISF